MLRTWPSARASRSASDFCASGVRYSTDLIASFRFAKTSTLHMRELLHPRFYPSNVAEATRAFRVPHFAGAMTGLHLGRDRRTRAARSEARDLRFNRRRCVLEAVAHLHTPIGRMLGMHAHRQLRFAEAHARVVVEIDDPTALRRAKARRVEAAASKRIAPQQPFHPDVIPLRPHPPPAPSFLAS